MSTKIYSGFRCATSDLLAIHHHLMQWRGRVDQLTEETTNQFVAKSATDLIDRAAVKGEKEDRPFFTATSDLWDRQKKIKREGGRDPEVDFDFNVMILPFDGRVFGIVYTEQSAWEKEFFALPWVEEYRYWNNTDPPENVPEAAWNERRRVWDGIFEQDRFSRPSGCGYAADCASEPLYLRPASVLPFIKPMSERVARIAEKTLLNRFCEAEMDKLSDDDRLHRLTTVYMAGIRYLEGDDGKAAVEAESERITAAGLLPAIDEAVLLYEKNKAMTELVAHDQELGLY